MAFLSMAVFFLPTDSGEKMTLTISVLLSIVVFLLLVSKILPPTSSTIPLMAKYLLLTFVLNVITILVTVIIINVYFRGPTTHRVCLCYPIINYDTALQMPDWVRNVFLEIMPRLLCMKRPIPSMHIMLKKPATKKQLLALPGMTTINPALHHPHCPSSEMPKYDGAVAISRSIHSIGVI